MTGVRMSQLRQEDTGTIVSLLHRQCTDNGSTSLTSLSFTTDDDHSLPLTAASSESTSQLSDPTQMMMKFAEKNRECCSELDPQCPICGKSLQCVAGNQLLVNKHVDECLNKVAVNELLASEKAQTTSIGK